MFALVDCNNFYASCERVFQPWLENLPVVVLSNNDGCAIARSQQAKDIGVEMGTPYHFLEEMIQQHNIQIRSSNYTLYGDMSRRVMLTLGRFVHEMEVYSIDETFLSLFGRQYHDIHALCTEMRATIGRNQGIPVCVGVAPTKTLAKMANRYAKKMMKDTGVFIADTPKKVQQMLSWCDVKDIWGVGKQYGNMLISNGYLKAADLINAPEDFVRDRMTVVGHRLVKELKGTACIPWEFESEARDNICSSRSFGTLMTEKKDVQQAVAEFASKVAEKLRRDRTVTKRVHVFVNTNPHRKQDGQYHQGASINLLMASSNTPTIIKAALEALDLVWRQGYNYMKAGVLAHKIEPENAVQTSLWVPVDNSKQKRAMQVLDAINQKYGRNTVKVATLGQARAYAMRAAYLSQRYTTCINEVPKVKCY